MIEANYLSITTAVVAAFVVSSVWYIAFGEVLTNVSSVNADAAADMSKPPAWKMLVELLRSLVVALVLAGFATQLGIADWTGAVQLGFATWIGFPVVLLAGSVIWENVPWKLAAIHVGDWLVKVLVIAVIVSVWR